MKSNILICTEKCPISPLNVKTLVLRLNKKMSYFATKNVLFRHGFPVLFLLQRFIIPFSLQFFETPNQVLKLDFALILTAVLELWTKTTHTHLNSYLNFWMSNIGVKVVNIRSHGGVKHLVSKRLLISGSTETSIIFKFWHLG